MWKYAINNETWTWMGGSDTTNHPGLYGERGVANTTFLPCSRLDAVGWYDSVREEFWLFGGIGHLGTHISPLSLRIKLHLIGIYLSIA